MARDKAYFYEQSKHVVDHERDLSIFHSRYHNDKNGARAYDSASTLFQTPHLEDGPLQLNPHWDHYRSPYQ